MEFVSILYTLSVRKSYKFSPELTLKYVEESCEEGRLALEASIPLTATAFKAITKFADNPDALKTLIIILNWKVLSRDMLLVDTIIEKIFDAIANAYFTDYKSLINMLIKNHTVLKRFRENPRSSSLASQLIASLQNFTEVAHILQIATLLLLFTKDRNLLEEHTAKCIIKLAASIIENPKDDADVYASCLFLTVACNMPILASRLRRMLMAGLLRKLFVLCTSKFSTWSVSFLIRIFETKLITPDFIQPHLIPLDLMLRWLNGYPTELIYSCCLLEALKLSGFISDSESQSSISIEIKALLNPLDQERIRMLLATVKTLKVDVLGLLETLVPNDLFWINICKDMEQKKYPEDSSVWLFSKLLWFKCSTDNAEILKATAKLLEMGLGQDIICLYANVKFIQEMQDKEIMRLLEDIRIFCLQSRVQKGIPTSKSFETVPDSVMSIDTYTRDDDKKELVRHMEEIAALHETLVKKENLILDLQLRLSREYSRQTLHSDKIKTTSIAFEGINSMISQIKIELRERVEIEVQTRHLFEVALHEIHHLKDLWQQAKSKAGLAHSKIQELEDKLVLCEGELNLSRDSCVESRERAMNAEAELAIVRESAQKSVSMLDERAHELEGRVRSLQAQCQASREQLLAQQLSEGQLELELASAKRMLELKEEIIRELRQDIGSK